MTKHKPTKRKPTKRKPSTALVRRPAPARLPPAVAATEIDRRLTEDIALGELGLVELKLTPQEETALSSAVQTGDVLIKPTGQPYVSHPTYTRLFNQAFGRTGWGLVPASKPMRSGDSVVCPYVLFLHGKPVAFAVGEQTYHETNRDQTYGDALESTVASALRRCAKRLGVFLELWDKRWCDRFVAEHGVRVVISRYDKKVYVWRLKTDPPFWNEVKGGKVSEPSEPEPEPAQRRSAPPPQEYGNAYTRAKEHYDGKGSAIISDAQRKRLWAITRNSGRSDTEVREWLQARYRLSSTKTITRALYNEICAAIEHPGDLPMREPGDE